MMSQISALKAGESDVRTWLHLVTWLEMLQFANLASIRSHSETWWGAGGLKKVVARQEQIILEEN